MEIEKNTCNQERNGMNTYIKTEGEEDIRGVRIEELEK